MAQYLRYHYNILLFCICVAFHCQLPRLDGPENGPRNFNNMLIRIVASLLVFCAFKIHSSTYFFMSKVTSCQKVCKLADFKNWKTQQSLDVLIP